MEVDGLPGSNSMRMMGLLVERGAASTLEIPFETRNTILRVVAHSVVVALLCGVSIALSSRLLYGSSPVGKLPLAASIAWFLSTPFMWLIAVHHGTPAAYWLSIGAWVFDIVARSLVLWFTYFRSASLWPNSPFLAHLATFIQVSLLAAFGFVLFTELSRDPALTTVNPSAANAVAIYLATDLLTVILEFILISRLWWLQSELKRQPNGKDESQLKSRSFYFAIVCITVCIGLSLITTALFVTGSDPYWTFNTMLFAFRVLMADVYSNHIRDSLIETFVVNRGNKSHMSTSSSRPSLQTRKPPQTPIMQDISQDSIVLGCNTSDDGTGNDFPPHGYANFSGYRPIAKVVVIQ